jgi:CIC family chloride channel protein
MAAAEFARARLRSLKLRWLRTEVRFVPSEQQRLFILTIVLGGLCGLAAVAFHLAIRLAERLAIGRAMSAAGHLWILWTILTPAAGGVLVGLLLHLVPNAAGSGVPQVKAAYATQRGRLRLRDSVGKFFISSLQIGTGASLGREGPTVHICAGLASALGRLTGVSQRNLRRLLPVGAAAGIAAAFNAPIAAVTFTIEEVVGTLDGTVLSGVIVAAALSAAVERTVLGEHPVFDVPQGYALNDPRSLLVCALLGVVAAGVSIAFTESLLGLRRRFQELASVPSWARPGIGGLVTGLLATTALLAWKSEGVTGGGYTTLASALTGRLTLGLLLTLCAFKLIATVASYSSGGAGGIFAPALFIGGMLGGAAGFLDHATFHHSSTALGAFALVGMGAVFSGIVRAPITSVLIIIEMTSGYSLILPLMIANMTAFAIARHYRPVPIYEALLEQDGIRLKEHELHDALEGMTLAEVPLALRSYISFGAAMKTADIMRSSALRVHQDVFPIVDGDGRMVGIVTSEDLVVIASEPELERLVHVTDLMRPPVSVRREDELRVVFERMLANGFHELPVVDEEQKILGFVEESAIARALVNANAQKKV